MATCLSDWPVEELPCVQADMSLLLIMAKQFCPGYSSSIFSQATPYFTFQFPPLCKRWVLTYFRLFLRWERRSRKRQERTRAETRNRSADQFCTASGFSQGVGIWIQRGKKTAYWEHFLSCVSLFQSMFSGTYRLQCCYSDINISEDLNCH